MAKKDQSADFGRKNETFFDGGPISIGIAKLFPRHCRSKNRTINAESGAESGAGGMW